LNIDIEKCRITHYPADVLGRSAEPIEKIDDNIHQLVKKMTEIMLKHKGIGLAGPQAGVGLQIFIISLTGKAEDVKVYINPEVKPFGELESAEEGCLSVPGISAKIRRYKRCTVTATDLQGDEFTEEAQGLYARCLQHENDHLQGTTIATRMGPASRIVHRRQLKKLTDEYKAAKE